MLKYIGRRILLMIPVLFCVVLLVFSILQLAPGDPARMILGDQATDAEIAAQRAKMGLDKPVAIQFLNYFTGLLRGDFGISYISKAPVAKEIFSRFPNTVKLSVVAALVSLMLALPLGIIAAVKQNSAFDNISMVLSLIGVSMPVFWMALMLMLLFAVKLNWLPAYGTGSWQNYVLPAASLGFLNMATIARTTRSSMLEVIRSDYIRTAYSKGLSKATVVLKHAFRNALIPVVTVVGMQISGLLGGSVLTETVFGWPGVGRYMIQCINNRDTPSVLGCIIMMTFCTSIMNLVVDILYGFIDPRVKSMYK